MPVKQITYSSELMMNFKQAEIVSPQKKFEALQTTDGFSLLFSISNDGEFYITQQTPGEVTGWKQENLSAKLAAANGGAAMKAKTFAVSQNFQSNKVDIALVVSSGGKDSLFLSLNNDAVADSITAEKIKWTSMPFDDKRHTGITVLVENLYIAETKKDQYIVVDISRKTFVQPTNFLERYYIDSKNKDQKWQNMVTGGNMDPGVSSMLGRRSKELVDGIYTLGSINGTTELVYVPLYNAFDKKAPPAVTYLQVPQGATALGTADIGKDLTDLFVVAGKSLYHFPADAQDKGAKGTLVQTHDLFEGVKQLYACVSNDKYVIWGHNRANNIFQTSCLKQNTNSPQMWTTPIPLLTKVEQVSPFINVKDTSNAFFAVAGNKLKKAVQSPQTSLWDYEQVALKAPAHLKARKYNSYTTRIQLTDGDKQPLEGQPLFISSSTRTSVYVNNLYYVLTPEPISIPTEENGSITIVEETGSLAGARLFISDASNTTKIEINPMDAPFNKISSLDTADKLKDARITDQNGNTSSLVKKDAKQDDLKAVATANAQLAKAYEDMSKGTLRAPMPLLYSMTSNTGYVPGVGKTVLAEIGDIFSWLADGVNYVVNLVVDAATGVWSFIVKIGEQVYQGILNCVEKIVGAIEWLYNAIKTAIEDLIKYLEFLFAWKDITRTKDVMKNLVLLFLNKQVDEIGNVKSQFDNQMKEMQRTLNNWAGIDSFKGLGEAATSKTNSQSRPADGQSAPGDMLSSHFRDNAGDAAVKATLMADHINDELVDRLFAAMKKSAGLIEDFFDQFESLAMEMPFLSLEQILKRVIAIILNAVIAGATAVVDVVLDILQAFARAAINLLNTDLYIPVVSDILGFFGVGKISVIDLFCWMAAVPFTLGYKIGHNEAPFKDDQYTRFFSTATKFDDVAAAFKRPKVVFQSVSADGWSSGVPVALPVIQGQVLSFDPQAPESGLNDPPIIIPESVGGTVYTLGHAVAGIALLFSTVVSAAEAAAMTGDNPWGIPSAVVGVLSAGSNGLANFLMPRYPIKNEAVAWINTSTTGLAILMKLVYSGPAQEKFSTTDNLFKKLSVKDGRSTGAIVNCVLIIPALACSCWHFYELSQLPEGKYRSAAIIDETSNVTSYFTRVFYAVAVQGASGKKAIKGMIAANLCTAGLQVAVAALQ